MEDSGAQCVGRMSPMTWPLLHVDCWDLVLKVKRAQYMHIAFIKTCTSIIHTQHTHTHTCITDAHEPQIMDMTGHQTVWGM